MLQILEVKVIPREPKKMSFLPRDLQCSKYLILNLEIGTFVKSKFCLPSLPPLKVITCRSTAGTLIWRDGTNEFREVSFIVTRGRGGGGGLRSWNWKSYIEKTSVPS